MQHTGLSMRAMGRYLQESEAAGLVGILITNLVMYGVFAVALFR